MLIFGLYPNPNKTHCLVEANGTGKFTLTRKERCHKCPKK